MKILLLLKGYLASGYMTDNGSQVDIFLTGKWKQWRKP